VILDLAENVSLTNDLKGNIAYHGQRVTFLCTIVADREILTTWRSPQYIRGDVLQLLSTSEDGHTVNNLQNPDTVATLINSTRSNGTVTVVTELQLTASAMYPISHVGCKANGREIQPVTIRFRKSDNLCKLEDFRICHPPDSGVHTVNI
jgi:hypothetical protein